MMILMSVDATPEQVDEVIRRIVMHKLQALRLPGDEHIAIGVASAIPPDLREPLTLSLSTLTGVESVVQITRPYKLASREFHRENTVVDVDGVQIGGPECVVMAGPCSVESREQILTAAQAVKAGGAKILRGGAFKPRTSPYAFQGLGETGLTLLQEAGKATGLPTVTEVMAPEDVPIVCEHASILQIGARNMHNYPLLIAAGRSGHPTLLKRGPSATLDEFLLAAEYLLHHGTPDVILCERGVQPLDRTYLRNTLDLSAVPVLKQVSHLPVIVDPSHGTGVARYVAPMARAALASGADGLMVEVHPCPSEALSDGQQSLSPEQFAELMSELSQIAGAIGRRV